MARARLRSAYRWVSSTRSRSRWTTVRYVRLRACWVTLPNRSASRSAAARCSSASAKLSWAAPRPARVYAQGTNGRLREYCWDKDKWYLGALSNEFSAIAAPGATSWLEGSQVRLRIYALAPDQQVHEYCWDGSGWYVGQFRSN